MCQDLTFYPKPSVLRTSINIITTKAIPTLRALRSRTSEDQDRVATLVGWAVPTPEVKASASGDYCSTKLTAHGFARGYCKRTRPFAVSRRETWCVPRCKTARRLGSTSGELPFAPAGLSGKGGWNQRQVPSIAKFSIARMATAGGPRVLPALNGGLSSAEDRDDKRCDKALGRDDARADFGLRSPNLTSSREQR
jgi:hypothetical protein